MEKIASAKWPTGKPFFVGDASADAKLSDYVRLLMERWIAAEPDRNAEELARRLEKAPAYLSQIRSGRRPGAGRSTLLALARLLNTSVEGITEAARTWDGTSDPPDPPIVESKVEIEERYPNRRIAVEYCRRQGDVSEEAITLVESTSNLGEDKPPDEWRLELLALTRRLRRPRDEAEQERLRAAAERDAGTETNEERRARMKRERGK